MYVKSRLTPHKTATYIGMLTTYEVLDFVCTSAFIKHAKG